MSETTRQVDLGALLDAFRAHWLVLAVPLVVVPALTLAWAAIVPPKLKSSARLLVEEPTEDSPGLRDIQVRTGVSRRLPAIHSIVRSTATLDRVLRELGEIDDATPALEAEQRIDGYRDQIEVWSEGGAIVQIKVVTRDPARAYRGLALLTDLLIEELVGPYTAVQNQSVTFLEEQVERVQGELVRIEEDLREFARQHADTLPDMQRANAAEHERLSRALLDARGELVAAEERQRLYEEELARFDPETERAADRLAVARARLRSLQAKFTDAHPEVKAAAAEVEERRSALGRAQAQSSRDGAEPLERFVRAADATGRPETMASYTAMVAQTQSLREKVAWLAKEEAAARERVRASADHEQELATLTLSRSAKSQVYQDLLARYEDAVVSRSLAGYAAASLVRIIEAPRAPAGPVGQPLLLLLAVGLMAGLGLGVVLVLAVEYLDPTVRSAQEAARIVDAPVLGVVGPLGPLDEAAPEPEAGAEAALGAHWAPPAGDAPVLASLAGDPEDAAAGPRRSDRTPSAGAGAAGAPPSRPAPKVARQRRTKTRHRR